MPKAEPRTLTRRLALIEYEDGTIEELNLGKPMVEYQVSQLGLDPVDNRSDAGFFGMWIAAGRPGANGHQLTIDTARPLMEAWLERVVNTEIVEEPGVPPTKPRGTSRTSAG